MPFTMLFAPIFTFSRVMCECSLQETPLVRKPWVKNPVSNQPSLIRLNKYWYNDKGSVLHFFSRGKWIEMNQAIYVNDNGSNLGR